MCRSIKTLFNFAPPATDEEVRAASLQFVRKLSGFTAPSKTNEVAFNRSVDDIFRVARRLVDSLSTTASPRNREDEAAKARARAAERFGPRGATSASSTRARARA
jgi:hypothetical protein